jgi:SOS-response transcriptional repressor LexA
MLDLGEKLTALRRRAGLSQKELAERLALYGVHVSNQAVSKWENGLTQPNADQFLALCRALDAENVGAEFFGRRTGMLRGLNDDGVRKLREYADLLRASGLYALPAEERAERVLPLYTLAVSAGTGQFLDSDDFESVIVGADVPDAADYGVRVAGNSMEPRYQDGQTVWVQYRRTLRSGEIGIFLYDDNAYLKQLIIDEQGVRLHSLNPDYSDIPIRSAGELRILGRVVM